jgi:hypothetical protein
MSTGWLKEYASGPKLAMEVVIHDVATVSKDELVGALQRHIQVIQDNMPALESCGEDLSIWKRSIQAAKAAARRLEKFPQTFEAGVFKVRGPTRAHPIYFLNIDDFNAKAGDRPDEVYFFTPIKNIDFVKKGLLRKRPKPEFSPADYGIGFISSMPTGPAKHPARAPPGDETVPYAPVTCPGCGHGNRPGVKFCAKCGRKLG